MSEFMNYTQVAKELGCSESTVGKRVKELKLIPVKYGKSFLLHSDEIEKIRETVKPLVVEQPKGGISPEVQEHIEEIKMIVLSISSQVKERESLLPQEVRQQLRTIENKVCNIELTCEDFKRRLTRMETKFHSNFELLKEVMLDNYTAEETISKVGSIRQDAEIRDRYQM